MVLLSLVFTVAYLWFFYSSAGVSEIDDAGLAGFIEILLLGVPTVVLLMGAIWLDQTNADEAFHRLLVGWTVGMSVLFVLAIYAALSVIDPVFQAREYGLLLLLSAGFGASTGVGVGIKAITSRYRQRQRDESRERTRRKELQRRQLEYLNQYLRHEVLNEANKISGYGTLLREQGSFDDETADYLDTICHSSTEIEVFIQSIRTILDDDSFSPDFSVVGLSEMLSTEVEHAERTYSNAKIVVDDTESSVVAGDLINRAFRNLFENAIEHNLGSVRIDVSIERDGKHIIATIEDDGGGIPAEDRETLFEPPATGDHGYGLFLTQNLVELYGGELTLADTGPNGTVFRLRLVAASTDEAVAESVDTPSPNGNLLKIDSQTAGSAVGIGADNVK